MAVGISHAFQGAGQKMHFDLPCELHKPVGSLQPSGCRGSMGLRSRRVAGAHRAPAARWLLGCRMLSKGLDRERTIPVSVRPYPWEEAVSSVWEGACMMKEFSHEAIGLPLVVEPM